MRLVRGDGRASARAKQLLLALGRHAWLVTAGLCLIVIALGLRGGDLPAQDFRVWLYQSHGFVLVDTTWYGGHADVGYGALFPVIGSAIGLLAAGVIACVLSTVLFCRLVGASDTTATAVIRLWFAVAVVVNLIVGRLPFAAGLACGLAMLVAVKSRRPWSALAAAVACSLFSPLAGAFAMLAVLAWLPSLGWRRALPTLGTLVGLGVAALTGDGGVFPFPTYTLIILLGLVIACLLVIPREQPLLRRGMALYGLACVALYVVPNPVGANIARLAAMIAGPLLVYLIVRVHSKAVPLLAAAIVPLLIWQALPVREAVASTLNDPSTKASYYDGLVDYLQAETPAGGRVEVVPTSQHWETTFVAKKVPLARGWDRQIDLKLNSVLYEPLSADDYRTWLLRNSVTFVALPARTTLDYGGEAEGELLETRPAWLVPAYSDSNWEVWRVNGSVPLVTGDAHLVTLTPGGFAVAFDKPGTALVRVRWSPYWRIATGAACLGEGADGMTELRATAAGEVSVFARLGVDADSRCATST